LTHNVLPSTYSTYLYIQSRYIRLESYIYIYINIYITFFFFYKQRKPSPPLKETTTQTKHKLPENPNKNINIQHTPLRLLQIIIHSVSPIRTQEQYIHPHLQQPTQRINISIFSGTNGFYINVCKRVFPWTNGFSFAYSQSLTMIRMKGTRNRELK